MNDPEAKNKSKTIADSTTELSERSIKADKRKFWHDILSLTGFVVSVIVGAILVNSFIFRSFDVVGPSMEPTLEGRGYSDRLIVNRLPVAWANLQGKPYQPKRGDIIVFESNLLTTTGQPEYVVKRVTGLPGERITVNNCHLYVHNQQHPDGFDPYPTFKNLAPDDKKVNPCVAGDGTDITVPQGEVFVSGDHRVDDYSTDSRNGSGRSSLGTIPFNKIVGPVALRIWPFNKLKVF